MGVEVAPPGGHLLNEGGIDRGHACPGRFGDEDEHAAVPVEAERRGPGRIGERRQEAGEARRAGRGRRGTARPGEDVRGPRQFALGHGRDPGAVARQDREGRRARLAAGQHLGFTVEVARYPDRPAGGESRGEAGRPIGLHRHDDARGRQPAGQALGHRGGEAADAGLDEEVGRALALGLVADLRRHHAVAGHDVPDDRVGGIVGGVGDEEAGADTGRDGRRRDCVVVGAGDPDDPGALIEDAPRPPGRHARMQEDPRRGPGEPRRRGDRKPVIAVAGAEQRRLPGGPRGQELGRARPGGAGERHEAGIGAAQRLEATEHPDALVLGEDLRHAEPPRQGRQGAQGRRRIGRIELAQEGGDRLGRGHKGGAGGSGVGHAPIMPQTGAAWRRNGASLRRFSPSSGPSCRTPSPSTASTRRSSPRSRSTT